MDAPLCPQARSSRTEALSKVGRIIEAREVFVEIGSSIWELNNVQLERIERLKRPVIDNMALTLDIWL